MATGFDPDNQDGFNDINITPFVDVVLVLLVIFMVAAPVMVKNVIEVKLPKAESGQDKPVTTLGISILANGQILLNGILMTAEELQIEAHKIKLSNDHAQALIAADLKTEHGFVVKVIDVIKSAGINDFALQVEKTKP